MFFDSDSKNSSDPMIMSLKPLSHFEADYSSWDLQNTDSFGL